MAMSEPLGKYDAKAVEAKWTAKWEEDGIYRYSKEDTSKPAFSIDTPPPYPSGEFHVGNALNWCYFDFVARYMRMKGFNVHFPQGWDCHGLPVEVGTEKRHGIRKRDIPPDKFRELCITFLEEQIAAMKNTMTQLGYSQDWKLEYRTMDPSYWKLTQLSFIILYRKELMYRSDHPVNWCPVCETAIAEAEVEYVERESTLYYIEFSRGGSSLTIATTRPELIPACVAVAVNPEDERNKGLVSGKISLPLFDREVPVIADYEVDPSFGTGVVMVCTYGDRVDVRWQKRHSLPMIRAINEIGKMTDEAKRYAGLSANEARKQIVSDLKSKALLEKEVKTKQSIGTCWRTHNPVEIISRLQWFMKTREMTPEVVGWADKVKWYPEFAKNRLTDWAESLDWDWVVSRQRVFGTPIPIWYCRECGQTIVAEEDWLPVDPRIEPPRIKDCPNCHSESFVGENDVMDTWMDSSLSCAIHAGWPYDMDSFQKLFPADIQPNGTDIVRTWTYYLMVKSLAMFGVAPYKAALINGMVRGTDGRMMHKSYHNFVETDKVLQKHSADAFRQWAAAGGSVGSDIPFRWEDVDYSSRFITKFWNAVRFSNINLKDYDQSSKPSEFHPLDRWILSKGERLLQRVTEHLDHFRFNEAMEDLRVFVWQIFCDDYIEFVKHRLYQSDVYGEMNRLSAQYTLHHLVRRIVQMLAPFTPFLSEEIYQHLYANHEAKRSIHETKWEGFDESLIDKAAETRCDIVAAFLRAVRQEKARRRLPLNSKLKVIKISDSENVSIIEALNEDIKGICKAGELEVSSSSDESYMPVESHPGLRFTFET